MDRLDRLTRIQAIVARLSDAPAAEHARILEKECGDNADLKRDVEAYMASDATHTDQPSSAPAFQLETERRIGCYEIIELLGQGGMGVVYLAEQKEPITRKVALKIVPRPMRQSQALARFHAERQVLANLTHPYIAQLYEASTTEEQLPFFAMEYVDGKPVTEFCDDQVLDLNARLELFRLVCEGVAHAHQKGVIHRDIKPNNILVARINGRNVPKIIDFGVAKVIDQGLLEDQDLTGQRILGTPSYMAPEVIQSGDDVDTRIDVYSLGILLYELLVGCKPHDAKGLGILQVLHRVAKDEASKPSTKWHSLSDEEQAQAATRRCSQPLAIEKRLRGDLDWIVMRAIAKDRDARYGSPTSLAEDLRRYLAHEPVEARPPSKWYVARKFFERNTFTVIGALVLVLALVGGIVGTTIGLTRAQAEADRAGNEAATAHEVSDFLVGLFQVSLPSEARGNSITAREILDNGAISIDKELHDQPLVQARMKNTIGMVYHSLGLYDEALPLLNSALAQLRDLGDRTEVAQCLSNIASLYWDKGDRAESLAFHQKALEMQRLLHPNGHPDVAHCLRSIAMIQRSEGDFDMAEPLLQEALALDRSEPNQPNPLVLKDLYQLASLHRERGTLDQAIATYREGLGLARDIYGDEAHPDRFELTRGLASSLSLEGDNESARPHYQQALDMARTLFGDRHPETAGAINNLAVFLVRRGEMEQAEPLFREVIEIRRDQLGEQHPEYANALNNLAVTVQRQGRVEEAEPLIRKCLAIQRASLTEDHPKISYSLGNLAGMLQQQHKFAEALPLCREALAMRIRIYGEQDSRVANTMGILANILWNMDQSNEADSYFAKALSISRDTLKADHPSLANIMSEYGKFLLDQAKLTEAATLFRDAMVIQETSLGPDHYQVAATLIGLAQVDVHGKRYPEAEERIRRAVTIMEKTYTSNDWRTAHARALLGSVLGQQSKIDEARTMLESALIIVQDTLGEDAKETQEIASWLKQIR